MRQTHAEASAGLLGAALDAILAQCIAEPFEPWPGSLVAALVAPEQLAETRVPSAVIELEKEVHCLDNVNSGKNLGDVSRVKRRKASGWQRFAAWWHPRQFASRLHLDWLDGHDTRAGRSLPVDGDKQPRRAGLDLLPSHADLLDPRQPLLPLDSTDQQNTTSASRLDNPASS